MRMFSISYDLANPQSNKHALATAIMSLGHAWARPLGTTWYLRADVSEREICDLLAPWLDPEDGLVVQAVSDKVVLHNATVRWFRKREATHTNVIAFPAPNESAAVQPE